MVNHCEKLKNHKKLVEDHNTYVGDRILYTTASYHNY